MPFAAMPEGRKPTVTVRHLGRVWTIPELARHYGTTYPRMARIVNADASGTYVRDDGGAAGKYVDGKLK